jgi:hypothetical protein
MFALVKDFSVVALGPIRVLWKGWLQAQQHPELKGARLVPVILPAAPDNLEALLDGYACYLLLKHGRVAAVTYDPQVARQYLGEVVEAQPF